MAAHLPVRPAAKAQGVNNTATERVLAAFMQTRDKTLLLVEHLSEADCTAQSMPDASPTKWHLAHTTWFFEVFVLERFEPNFKPFDPMFRMLFNSYYNGIGDKYPRAQRGLITRPGLSQVLAYRKNVQERVQTLLSTNSEQQTQVLEVVVLGINHEQQHQELILTDVKHLLWHNPLMPAYREGWPLVTAALAPSTFKTFEAGLVTIGASAQSSIDQFCFDNELPNHSVFLKPFELATQPISYGDVIDFIEDGGYKRAALWLSMGWDCVQSQKWRAPLYWLPDSGDKQAGWQTFTLRGVCLVSRNVVAPHLSYFEADAIARWKQARLPTEAEWEHAALQQTQAASLRHANLLESDFLHPLALQAEPNPNALCQMFGDVWEWTQSSYNAYPGFKSAPGAVGEYNGKFMCNQFVLRGGSCFTPQSHIRSSYRNFFPADARWQVSGVRLARDV
jgi:ergothioneine biosynthesis protein EgtB